MPGLIPSPYIICGIENTAISFSNTLSSVDAYDLRLPTSVIIDAVAEFV